MNCWYCKGELIWGPDVDIEDEQSEYSMVSFLTCSKCESAVEIYKKKEEVIS